MATVCVCVTDIVERSPETERAEGERGSVRVGGGRERERKREFTYWWIPLESQRV